VDITRRQSAVTDNLPTAGTMLPQRYLRLRVFHKTAE
jgi:hypothetical protein